MSMLSSCFFSQSAIDVAKGLLGKIIHRYYNKQWLCARIIETEAYCCDEKASHSSLGRTPKREAMFMSPGTIYMYYARGKDSLNISCGNTGDAVLIKSAYPELNDPKATDEMLSMMQKLNPTHDNEIRPIEKLCKGQTLLCQALALKVNNWDQRQFDKAVFYINDDHTQSRDIVQTKRLGIPLHRDAHLMYRYIDLDYIKYCTENPLTKRNSVSDCDYIILSE